MTTSFGLSGKIEIIIKKADGRVFSSTTDNDLRENIRMELADRITDSAFTYNTRYSPDRIKIYAKGYAGVGNEAAVWYTNWLEDDSVNQDGDAFKIESGNNDNDEATVTYIYPNLIFAKDDTTTLDLFDPAFDAIEADGANTHIYAVQLGGNVSDVLAQAYTNESAYESFSGASDLTGDVGEAKLIDNDDKVTIKYTLTFKAEDRGALTDSQTSSLPYLKRLRGTVQRPTDEPDVAVYQFGLTYVDANDVVRTATQDLGTGAFAAGKINQWDAVQPNDTTVIYVGNPNFPEYESNVVDMALESGVVRAATPVISFDSVPSPNRPTGVTVKTSEDVIISEHTITDLDIPSWNINDNVKLSWFAYIGSDDIQT